MSEERGGRRQEREREGNRFFLTSLTSCLLPRPSSLITHYSLLLVQRFQNVVRNIGIRKPGDFVAEDQREILVFGDFRDGLTHIFQRLRAILQSVILQLLVEVRFALLQSLFRFALRLIVVIQVLLILRVQLP